MEEEKSTRSMKSEDGEVVLLGRAEIDRRAPFRSVKEAIVLFGERVLVGQVYANKRGEMGAAASHSDKHSIATLGSVVAELEGTKTVLEKAREENLAMAGSLCSLQEELHRTREELQRMRAREWEKRAVESDVEDVKFVEEATEVEVGTAATGDGRRELQKRRYVKFANPPSLAQVMTPEAPQVLERQFSVDKVTAPTTTTMRRKKKNPWIHLLGGIFSKKKDHREVTSPRGQ